MNNQPERQAPRAVMLLEAVLFNVKWILPVFYIGLVVVMILYGATYLRNLLAVLLRFPELSMEDMKIVVLDCVDTVMVANLVKMIVTGSYNSFISKEHGRPNENISSGSLKIKITTSIIVVCCIYLLRSFVSPDASWPDVQKKLAIFAAFLATTLVLGVLEYLHVQGEVLAARQEK